MEKYRWLTHRQFLDAVSVGVALPGPVVKTSGFIGYLIGGFPGAFAASLGIFLPSFLVVMLVAPYFERYGDNPQFKAFTRGVTTAAIGAIAGSVIILGQKAVTDVPTALIAAATFFLLFFFKIPEYFLVLAAGAAGYFLCGTHF